MQFAVDGERDICARISEQEQELTPAWIEGVLDGLQAWSGSSPEMARGHDYAHGWLMARCEPRLARQLLRQARLIGS
jgi:hypothetical protein